MTEDLLNLEKREWCYVQPPSRYDVAPCKCGNHDTQWSEFKGRVWCEKCKIDFIPEHNGIFDSPIPVKVAMLFGISFDRIDLKTNEIIKFELKED
jgi:hypothetical protein